MAVGSASAGNTMLKRLWAGSLIAVLVASVAFWLHASRSTRPGSAGPDEPPPVSMESPTTHAEALRAAALIKTDGSADTPPMSVAPTEQDGAFVIHVRTPEGPLVGANVRVYWRGNRDPNTAAIDWRLAGTGSTDRRGIARVLAPSGEYLIAARGNPFAPAHVTATRAPSEKETHVELVLGPATQLRGTVVSKATHGPVEGAKISVRPDTEGQWLRSPESPAEESVTATAGANGEFVVSGLGIGHYEVSVASAGFARWKRSAIAAPNNVSVELIAAAGVKGRVADSSGKPAAGATVFAVGGDTPASTQTGADGRFSLELQPGKFSLSAKRGREAGGLLEPIVVGAGAQRTNIVLTLAASGSIEGTVTSSRGVPVPGAVISVSPYLSSGDSGRALAAEDGRYRVEGLAPGTYDVVVNASGFSDSMRRAVVLRAGQTFPISFELKGTGSIAGRVSDRAGAPVPGVTVRSVSFDEAAGGSERQGRSDAEGHFRIDGVPLGETGVLAESRPGALDSMRVVTVNEATPAQVELTVDATTTLTGHVTRANGAPVEPGSFVTAFRPSARGAPRQMVPIDGDGRYKLELVPDTYRVVATPSERTLWGVGGKSVTLEANVPAVLDLVVNEEDRTGPSGTVVEPDGSPSPGALVIAKDDQGRPADRTFTGADGRFQLRASSTGSQPVVLFARSGGRTGTAPVSSGVVRLEAAGAVHGIVANVSGSAFTVNVVSRREMMGWETGVRDFVGDTFDLADVQPGAVEIRVETMDGRHATVQATVSAGTVTNVEIDALAARN